MDDGGPNTGSRGGGTIAGDRASRGAYGIALEGIPAAAALLGPAGPAWPTLHIEQQVSPRHDPVVPYWDDERALFNVAGGGSVEVDRATMAVTFDLPSRAPDPHIVHPFLAGSAAIVSRWLGRETLHGGVFEIDGGAWAVLGDKGSGKSSTLGWLARRDFTVATDDLVVIDDGTVLAGPACIDLRGDAAGHLGLGEHLGVVGARERWRALVPPAPPRLPLAGWILPQWADAVDVAVVPPRDRLPLLLGNLTLRAVVDPVTFLDLARLPTLALRRPQRWDSVDPAMSHLLEVIGDGVAGPGGAAQRSQADRSRPMRS